MAIRMKPIAFLTCTIHIPERGNAVADDEKMPRNKYGSPRPMASTKNIRKPSIGLCRLLTRAISEITNGPTHGADRKSTRLNSSHSQISYAVFCLKKKNSKTYSWTEQHIYESSLT